MGNILVLAEKPDVAKDIAGAMLEKAKTEKAYTYGQVGADTWVITSAYGHLLELCDPADYDKRYEKWTLEDLPLYFPDWKLREPDPDGRNQYKIDRLRLIGKLLEKSDSVICAGDPDDEGQLLIDEILDYFEYKGPAKRVFINDSMPENIRKEFAAMKDNDEYRPLSMAAGARRMADYCFGVNESRLAGIKLKRKGLSIGRVQTPTLGLVVARDRLIEGHVKAKFYELALGLATTEFPGLSGFKMKPDKAYLTDFDTDRVLDRDFLENIAKKLKGKEVDFKTVVKDKLSNPPLPYNLTVLSADMNKRYGYPMSKTLALTQSLRGKHAITYNRSDSQYLKEEHYQEAPSLFRTILGGALVGQYKLDFSRHSACFNDKNVTAHHGIIPQKNNIDVNKLPEDERNVYMAIAERYAMQFMQPLRQKVSTSTFTETIDEYTHSFEHSAVRTVDPGYTGYFKNDKDDKEKEEEKKVFFEEGSHHGTIKAHKIDEKETKPPARYTDGTLGNDMASIAKYVKDPQIREILKRKDEGKKGENGSIGTVATRGSIVELLIQRKFLERKGKTIISTTLGREFYDLLPTTLTGADTTAKWWLIQEEIKDGKQTDVNAIQLSVLEEFKSHIDTAYEGKAFNSAGGKPRVRGVWNGNEVAVNKTWGDHSFTEEELERLFAGETITFTTGYGRVITGKLAQQTYKNVEYVGFLRDQVDKEPGYIYGKFKRKEIKFKDTWSGHTFTEEEAQKLLKGEELTIEARARDGSAYTVTGKLAQQTYQGHKFYGFMRTDQKNSSVTQKN